MVSVADEIETSIAPAAIERAMAVFEKFKEPRPRPTRAGPQGAHGPHLRSGSRRSDRRGAAGRFRTEAPQVGRANDHGGQAMRIRSHSESHVVELEDGSRWQIFPGDLDLTLDWKPETELVVEPIEDDVTPMRWSAPAPRCA